MANALRLPLTDLPLLASQPEHLSIIFCLSPYFEGSALTDSFASEGHITAERAPVHFALSANVHRSMRSSVVKHPPTLLNHLAAAEPRMTRQRSPRHLQLKL